MSIATIITAGFGNGTYNGSISEIVTFGYTLGEDAGVTGPSLGVSSAISLTLGVSSEIKLTIGADGNVELTAGFSGGIN